MKKINLLHFLFTILLSSMASNVMAQFECTNLFNASLTPDGTYLLFPEDLLTEGDLNGYTATLSQSAFDCGDVGNHSITLEIFENGNPVFSCSSTVVIEDNIEPVVQCITGLTVALDGTGQYELTAADIDNGSSDECGGLTYAFSPASLDCESANPSAVTMTVSDASGNSSMCTVNVFWEPYPDPTPNLACNAFVVVSLAFGETVEVTPGMILEGGPYGCPDQYAVEISENMIVRPQPIVTLDDTNKILVVKITDLNTSNACWGELAVVVEGGCDPVFTICDTECRSTPFGDCDSGHTADDHVEWPCDIDLATDCYFTDFSVYPQYLVENGYAEPEDATPQIINNACYATGLAYNDQVFFMSGMVRVERQWSIIYWYTGEIWSYTQTINILLGGIDICDTLPWNTPLGDCASGHTDTDDVEWPADITVSTNCIHPEDLQMNAEVDAMDVQPTVSTDCNSFQMTFADLVFVINDSTLSVERTWSIIDLNTLEVWNYTQTIAVNNVSDASMVCTMREGGEPIPGVELISGIETDDSGCHTFENPDGITVTPVKDSPLAEGVNLLDKILMMEHVLGISQLSIYQQYAADLSQNGFISTLDVVMLDKIIDGTFVPTFDHNWKFFERNTHQSSADISNPLMAYKFIGVKMGDLDNSYTFDGQAPPEDISLYITDEILNKKEAYLVPFYLHENKRVLGFSVKIQSEEIDIDFLSVVAPELPGFNMDDHVVITPGLVSINYIAPEEYLKHGIALPSGTALFSIHLKPLDNGILSESLSLESSHANLLKPVDDARTITFSWEDIIISGVLNPGEINPLQFYPNPVLNEIHLVGFDASQRGEVSVFDATGRVLSVSPLSPVISVDATAPGMYFLNVSLEDGKRYTAPFIKL